jgi:molybdopterin/thiamine biosynthesis adenylyltransferase
MDPAWRGVDLGEVHLVGIGAIGNAAVWTLARASKLAGRLHVVDPESVELTNLQRYALTTQGDVGRPKVEIAAATLKRSRLDVQKHAVAWADYVTTRNDWRLEHVAVALDTPRDRIAVQSSLPRYIVNSWTQPGDLGISRHGFVGHNACLACLYLPDKASRNEDEIIAEALGLAGESAVKDVRQRLATSTPTDRPFLAQVATALGIPAEALLKFEGQSLRSFYTQAICGGAVFQLTDGKKSGPALVPMAFQSALAGVLLAAEIVARGAGLSRPAETKTTIDLLRPQTPVLLQPRAKARLGNCICQDDDYIGAWRAKYECFTS